MKRTHIIIISVVVCVLLGLLIYFRTREKDDTTTEMKMNTCPEGHDVINGVCIPPCSNLYDTKGTTCFEKCLDGEIDADDSCKSITGRIRKKKTVSRIPEVMSRPPAECEEGYEGAFENQLCFQSCTGNNYVNFQHMCAESCPTGTREIGAMCVYTDGHMVLRNTYIPQYTWSKYMKDQNAPDKALSCPTGMETHSDVLCVDKCTSGYTTHGGLCMEECQEGETDIGVACLKGIVTRLKTVRFPTYTTIPMKQRV